MRPDEKANGDVQQMSVDTAPVPANGEGEDRSIDWQLLSKYIITFIIE